MSSLADPRAIIFLLIMATVLVSLLKGKDPIELLARWAYAFRRGVWILGTMLWDSAGEFRHRWQTQRPKDAAALLELEREFPAGETE